LEFGDFRVRRNQLKDQTILIFEGTPNPSLGQELERLVTRCKGTVGIDFSDLHGLSQAIVPVLERVRKRLLSLKRSFFLCNPPSKLLDALTLGGIAEQYSIVNSREGKVPSLNQSLLAGPDRIDPQQTAAETARREIVRFEHSLKQTARLERGLDHAARCVRKMLPAHEPVLPGYSFAFVYRQSEILGGDFFDFIPLEGNHLGIAVGDVSGNGLEAAILMCVVKKVIAIRAKTKRADTGIRSPREVLTLANDDIRTDLDRTSFITALYGVLDAERGAFWFARAGHEKPIWFAPGSKEEPRLVTSDGLALGPAGSTMFRSRIQDEKIDIQPGERILLMTDGLVDSRSQRGQTFSRARLLDALRRTHPRQSPRETLEALLDEVAHHTGGGPPQDDISLLLIARESSSGAER